MDVFRVRKTRDPGTGGSMGTLDSVHSEQVQGIRDSGTKQDDLKQKLTELRTKREELNESSRGWSSKKSGLLVVEILKIFNITEIDN